MSDLSDLSEGRTRSDLAQDVTFESIGFRDPDGGYAETHFEGEALDIVLRLRVTRPIRDAALRAQVRVSTGEGLLLFTPALNLERDLDPGTYETSFHLDPNPLGAGTYQIELYMATHAMASGETAQDQVPQATSFHMETNPSQRDGGHYLKKSRRGMLYITGPWSGLEAVEPATTGIASAP
jgi:hypothetical protein